MADADEPGARLRFALDLFEAACDLYKRRIRREHPSISGEEMDALVAAWIRDRPGAPYGDAAGRRRTFATPK
jgi:hypothetical protein